jgi:fructose-1,6-bisphosphatase/inositol monophosphatase family enzyme
VDGADLIDPVSAAMRAVAAEIILPRFRAVVDGDVSEKAPGELVTVADVEAERALAATLSELLPGSLVVGEEAVAADPGVLPAGAASARTWVIDPIDGTWAFVAGTEHFTVMVALIEDGVTTAAWILQPATGRLFTAVRGGGARLDGEVLVRTPAPDRLADLRARLVTRLLGPEVAEEVIRRAGPIGHLDTDRLPAGIEYGRVALGELDAVLYLRTHVWDHAPGALLLEEAGGRVTRLDGSGYDPWSDRTGLLLAADPATSRRVLELIAPTGRL